MYHGVEIQGNSSEDCEVANYWNGRKVFVKSDKEKSAENCVSEDGRIGCQVRLLSWETDEDVICEICQ